MHRLGQGATVASDALSKRRRVVPAFQHANRSSVYRSMIKKTFVHCGGMPNVRNVVDVVNELRDARVAYAEIVTAWLGHFLHQTRRRQHGEPLTSLGIGQPYVFVGGALRSK